MTVEDDTTTVDDAQGLADFAGGFDGKTAEKIAAKEKPAPAETPRVEAPPEPEYVQITKAELAEMKAAAAKTASYDQQLAKAFGTIGNVQKIVNELRAQTPRELEVKLPDQAFTKMAKDFPELAELSREEFQAALAGLKAAGNTKPDPGAIKKVQMELEQEDLEDAIPDWKEIVGAVSDKAEADQNNPFRKWLATKPAAYQDRINGTIRAPIIQRAIQMFRTETKVQLKPPAAPAARDNVRADRIRAAVQPRGDGAIASSGGKTDEEQFEEGFRSR